MNKLLAIASGALLLYAALTAGLIVGAGLSRVVARTAVHPFAGIADAASFDMEEGAKLFVANCAICHQASGEGIPGVFPPLKGNGVVQAPDPTQQILVLLQGIQGANIGGVVYSTPMPPFAITLSDEQVADIVDYERTSWGNHAPLATAREVAAVRATLKH